MSHADVAVQKDTKLELSSQMGIVISLIFVVDDTCLRRIKMETNATKKQFAEDKPTALKQHET